MMCRTVSSETVHFYLSEMLSRTISTPATVRGTNTKEPVLIFPKRKRTLAEPTFPDQSRQQKVPTKDQTAAWGLEGHSPDEPAHFSRFV